MNSHNDKRPDWQRWTLGDWNAALFEHVFSARDGDHTPVSRLVLTDDEFGRVVGDSSQPPGAVRESFRAAVLNRLADSGYTLLGDAKVKWYDPASQIPPFFAHLVVTCIAATWDTDPVNPDGVFRPRLNRFLDRDEKTYWLNDLPHLWERVRDWLDAAIGTGKPYRSLVLRRQSHMRIIGYSIELAFPSLQDTTELVALFSQHAIHSPPTVLPVLSVVQKYLPRFGHRFRAAFEEFDQAVREHDPLRYRCPFWSVVLEAARLGSQHRDQPRSKVSKVELALEFGPDGSSRVVPFLDAPPVSRPISPHVLIEDQFLSVEGYSFVLETEPTVPPGATVGGLTLAGKLSTVLPKASTADIDRIVSDGILLFARSENQSWLLCRSRPASGEIRSLVREGSLSAFLEAVRMRGGKPLSLQSVYQGWFQVDAFTADELPLGAEWATTIRCLDETINSPRITLSEGVMVPSGWLGLQGWLPRVAVDAESVTIEPSSATARAGVEVRMERDPSTNGYIIPVVPDLGRPLVGRYLIRARHNDQIVAVRPVDFRAHAYGHEYCPPSNPGRWLVESSLGDMAGLTSPQQPTWSTGGSPPNLPHYSVEASALGLTTDYPASEAAESLGEVLAAIGTRRRGIDEPEVIETVSRALDLSGTLAWDVARGWVEAGLLDCFVYRHWKKRTYFPRSPRLIVHRKAGSAEFYGTVLGLLPFLSRRQVEEAASAQGLRFGYVTQLSPFLLPPLVIEADSLEAMERVRVTSKLGFSETLPAIEECSVPIDTAPPSLTVRPQGYESVGTWDWSSGRFVQETADVGSRLERLVRRDAPDVFVVWDDNEPTWVGWSRAWAFLVAARRMEARLVENRGKGVIRVTAKGVRLPVPMARWACASTGVCPGPAIAEGTRSDYLYKFPDSDPASLVEGLLLGRKSNLRWVEKARWISVVASARVRTTARLATVPPRVRSVFHAHSEIPALRDLARMASIPRELLPQVLALTREIELANER